MKRVFAILAILILIACAQQEAPIQKRAIPQIEIAPPTAPRFPEKPEYEPPPSEPTVTNSS